MVESNKGSGNKNTHLLLAKLLERQRSTEHKNEVDSILESGLSVPDKVAAIQKLDDENVEGSSGYISARPARAAATPEGRGESERAGKAADEGERVADELLPDENEDPSWQRELKRTRLNIKNKVDPVGYLGFLFYDWSRIRKFNQEYGFLHLRLMPSKFTLNANRLQQFRSRVIEAADELRIVLDGVLADGWQYLTKADYNLLGLLHNVCVSIVGLDLTGAAAGNRELLKLFRSVERRYLVYRRQDRDGTAGDRALKLYQERKNDESVDWKRVFQRYYQVMAPCTAGGFVETMVLALNMVYHRRFVTIESLINERIGTLISTDEFECSPEIRKKIRSYLHDVIRQLPRYVTALREVMRVRLFMPEEGDDERLRAFYDTYAVSEESFEAATKHVLRLIMHLGEGMVAVAEPLLDGVIVVEEIGRLRVFGADMFNDELSRMRLVLARLEKLSYSVPTFTIDRYFQLRHRGSTATASETEALGRIDDFLFHVVQIAKKLMDIMGKRSPTPVESEQAELPLGPEILQHGIFYAPVFEANLDGEGFWARGSLVGGMQRLTQLLLEIADYFEEPSIVAILRRESRLRREIERRIAIIDTIASRDVAAAVRERFSL